MSSDACSPPLSSARTHRLRWLTAVVLILAFTLDLLNVTIVNVGLPAIQNDLGASNNEIAWISAAYLLAFAVALITAARLGDLLGRKRMFLIGLTTFAAAGIWAGYAANAAELIAARALQGFSAALVIPQVMSILYGLFDDEERATVFGIFGLVASLAQAAGLLAGGVLITADPGDLGWRSIFLISVPLALVLVGIGAWLVPESAIEGAARPRWAAAALLTAGLVAIVFPLLEGHRHGWPLWCWALLIAGFAAIAGLIALENKSTTWRNGALLPAPFFRPRSIRVGLLVLVPAFASFSGFLFVFPLWLQSGQGYSALQTGIVTAAFSAGGLAMTLFVGRLAVRFGRMVVLVGCLIAAAGALALLCAGLGGPRTPGLWSLVPGLFLLGVGINMVMPTLTSLFLSAVPPDYAGAASGIWNTAMQFGAALGVAVLSTVFFAVLSSEGVAPAFVTSIVSIASVLVVSAAICLALAPARSSVSGS